LGGDLSCSVASALWLLASALLPGRGLPGGNSLSFASPKESKQRKGDPQSGPLCGSLKKLKETENLETCLLRSLRTSKFFNPSPSTFSSPARTGGGINSGAGAALSCRPQPWQSQSFFTLSRCAQAHLEPQRSAPALSQREREEVRIRICFQPVLAGLRSAGGSGPKFLDVRRLRSRQVSKNSAAFEHRKLPEAKRRDPDCGSPFFSLGFFGEAKKSKSPAGASPGLYARQSKDPVKCSQ
jgi:hypothetical protein